MSIMYSREEFCGNTKMIYNDDKIRIMIIITPYLLIGNKPDD